MLPRGASMRTLRTRLSLRGADRLLARQHLQVPEPEEDDPEQHEGDAAEHGDAPRQLGRDRPDAFFYALRHHRREIGLSPPVV